MSATSFTLNKLAYSLLELLRGSLKDTEDVDIRELYFFIQTQRALWISKSLEDKSIFPFEQDCGVFELELVDSVVDDAILTSKGYDSNHTLLRTIKNVPKPIYRAGVPLLTRVGSVDRHIQDFHVVSYKKAVISGNGRFNHRHYYAYYLNEKVYIKSSAIEAGALKYINIRGIFEDPTALANFSTIEGKRCYDPNDPYPVSGDLIDYMLGEIVKTRLPMMMSAPNDIKNDSAHTIQSPQDATPK